MLLFQITMYLVTIRVSFSKKNRRTDVRKETAVRTLIYLDSMLLAIYEKQEVLSSDQVIGIMQVEKLIIRHFFMPIDPILGLSRQVDKNS